MGSEMCIRDRKSGTRMLMNHRIHVAIITPYFRFMLYSPLQTAVFSEAAVLKSLLHNKNQNDFLALTGNYTSMMIGRIIGLRLVFS